MARIWYSVCGEGVGHAVRSHTILAELTKKHDVLITAAECAFPYLRDRYGSIVHRIRGNIYVYEDNSVRRVKSVAKFFRNMPSQVKSNYRILRHLFNHFQPEIIISDFESASHYYSRVYRIPCISIDNIHSLTEFRYSLRRPVYIAPMIRFLHPLSDHYIIPSFANFKIKRPKQTKLVPPIVREEVRSLRPKKGDFVLVYQTSKTNTGMLPVLRKSDSRFKIYGMGQTGTEHNLEFMPFNEQSFMDDLRSCRYVIVNGGFTVLSEALYLKKPVLCIPIRKQFEQEWNGYYLKREGFGSYTKRLTGKDLVLFEQNLKIYQESLARLGRWDNSELFRHLEETIKKYDKTFLY